VQLRKLAGEEPVTMMVDDRSGIANVVQPLPGDRIAQWIRWIHEGSHSGLLWQFIVFLCGIFPAVLGVTGVVVWLRRRASRSTIDRTGAEHIAQLGATE
jgi:uncharacterized iron-regulated membrane protein